MAKFHINSKGVPASCKAKPGNCPFGAEDSHYDSLKEAQTAADTIYELHHNILPSSSSGTKDNKKDNVSKLNKVISNINTKYKEDDEYITINPKHVFDEDFDKQYNPQGKIDDYLKGRIIQHSGIKVDLDYYENLNWYTEVENNRDFYNTGKCIQNEKDGDKYYNDWTEESENHYQAALEQADKAYVYFGERQDLINDTFKEVQRVDWTIYHDTQLEGEIAALNKIHEDKIISM